MTKQQIVAQIQNPRLTNLGSLGVALVKASKS